MDLGIALGALGLTVCLLAAFLRIAEQRAETVANDGREMGVSLRLTVIRGSKRISSRLLAARSSRERLQGHLGPSRGPTPTYTGVLLGMALSTGMRSRNAGARPCGPASTTADARESTAPTTRRGKEKK